MGKGLLLRVGIDSCRDTGGDFGPIFFDGRFEYIPIEGWPKVKTETYSEHECQNHNLEFGSHWSDFLRPALGDRKIHHDPILCGSWTYGECPTKLKKRGRNCKPTPKMRALEKLEEDDLVVFTAGLKKWPETTDDRHHIYIIGYLRIKKAIPFYKLTNRESNRQRRMFANELSRNAHFIEQDQLPHTRSLESSVVIVGKGYPQSRLLKYAARISELGRDKAGHPLRIIGKRVPSIDGKTRDWTQILGLPGSVQRSTPRPISPEHVNILERELGIVT